MRLADVLVTLGLVATPVGAEMSASHQEWVVGPVSFLFTATDREAWKAVVTDAEAIAFELLFWARRDPVALTPENEFKNEFDRRVAEADERFYDEGGRGALTDRGWVSIVMGPPNQAIREGGSSFATGANPSNGIGLGSGMSTGAADFAESVVDIWIYEKDRMPSGVSSNRLTFRFRTERDYGVGVLERHKTVLEALRRAVENALVRPDLTLAELSGAPQSHEGEVPPIEVSP